MSFLQQTFENWAKVFNVSGGLAVVGIVIFCAFASAEEQPWNRYGEEEAKDGEKEDQAEKKPVEVELSQVNGHAATPVVTEEQSGPSGSASPRENDQATQKRS